jgi:hypothetical protein
MFHIQIVLATILLINEFVRKWWKTNSFNCNVSFDQEISFGLRNQLILNWAISTNKHAYFLLTADIRKTELWFWENKKMQEVKATWNSTKRIYGNPIFMYTTKHYPKLYDACENKEHIKYLNKGCVMICMNSGCKL